MEARGTWAALTRGVGKFSITLASRGLGSDDVDVPGRAKDKTEGSISRGLSDERISESVTGNVAALCEETGLIEIPCLLGPSEFKSWPTLGDGGSVMADEEPDDDCVRIDVVSEVVVLEKSTSGAPG
jgi:hypothetical protein